MKNLKRWLNQGETLLGCRLNPGSSVTAEIVEFAALDSIDVLFIGPFDLSMELGIFGQYNDPRFKDALKATVNAAEKAGKSTGILLSDPNDFQLYHDMGIRMIACGADAAFVANGARGMVEKLTEQRSKITNP